MADTKKKLAIYGGSFSPPHIGHLLSAREYLRASGADEVVIIPAKRPPHKRLDGMVTDEQRLEMCRIAFCEDEVLRGKCRISDYEISRDETSYTINTVEHFLAEGYSDISILIGTDMLISFESWYRFRDLFALVTVYYIDRYDGSKNTAREFADRYRSEYGARIITLDAPVFEASSTDIRDILASGLSADGALDKRVEEFIIKNSLYRRD